MFFVYFFCFFRQNTVNDGFLLSNIKLLKLLNGLRCKLKTWNMRGNTWKNQRASFGGNQSRTVIWVFKSKTVKKLEGFNSFSSHTNYERGIKFLDLVPLENVAVVLVPTINWF